MAPFHFSLEKVLRWRSIQLTAEEIKLKRLLQEQLHLQTLAAELGAEKSRVLSSLATSTDLRGSDLHAASAYSIRLKRHAEKIGQQLIRCQKDLAIRRSKYQEAKQRVQLLEELKARGLTAWRSEEAHQLEALASEAYLATWNRDRL